MENQKYFNLEQFLLCGLSNSFAVLIICRFLQGIGASAYMANNHGIITELFPKESRGKALGVLVTAVALGNMVGPSIGGMILSVFNWNYIFYINVPFGIGVFILGLRFLPKGERKDECMDIVGAILQFIVTLLFFGSLILSQQTEQLNPYIMASIGISIVLAILPNIGEQTALKLSPFYAGLFMMLSPLVLAVCSPIFGSISDKVSSEKVIFIGLLVLSLGFFLMSRLTETSPVFLFALSVATMAVGQAIFQPANNALIMSTCPKDKLGIVGSVNSLVRNLGQTVGIALSTTLLYFFMSDFAGYRVSDYILKKP